MNSHACIINEYDTLFLHRDGRPTLASRKEFDYLLGPKATPEQRFALERLRPGRVDRVLAGASELCGRDVPRLPRRRRAATPSPATTFATCERLVLDPYFADYVGDAFKPLGVYVNFWQPQLPAGRQAELPRDDGQRRLTNLPAADSTSFGSPRRAVARQGEPERAFDIPGLGQVTYDIELTTPAEAGQYQLKAQAFWDGKPWSPTVSRRNVEVK